MSTRLSAKRHSSISNVSGYHHEIELIDNTLSSHRSLSSRQNSTNSGHRKKSKISVWRQNCYPSHLRNGLNKSKRKNQQDHEHEHVGIDNTHLIEPTEESKDRPLKNKGKKAQRQIQQKNTLITQANHTHQDSAVDILYENQRGGVFFGKSLFSAKALGNLDPAPWTNIAQRPSATDITNSQPPDPSWEWAGTQWLIYPTEHSDEGWEYSFAFHGRFSWHKCKWWNSFVRRRAWVRKRIRKKDYDYVNNQHTIDSEYFTVVPVTLKQRKTSSSIIGMSSCESYVLLGRHKTEDEPQKDITDVKTLKQVLKAARIDREIIEAIENFIQNGKEDFLDLKEQMHEIMDLFIFQTSRRILTFLLLRQLIIALENWHNSSEFENKDKRKRVEILDAALKVAEEESRNHEFWSELRKYSKLSHTMTLLSSMSSKVNFE